MKITIEAETIEEQAAIKEPWVREGVQRFGLSGRLDPKVDNFEFGFVHGPWGAVKADLSRFIIDGDAMAQNQAAINAVIQAHNIMAQQAEAARIGAELRNGRSNLRLH